MMDFRGCVLLHVWGKGFSTSLFCRDWNDVKFFKFNLRYVNYGKYIQIYSNIIFAVMRNILIMLSQVVVELCTKYHVLKCVVEFQRNINNSFNKNSKMEICVQKNISTVKCLFFV